MRDTKIRNHERPTAIDREREQSAREMGFGLAFTTNWHSRSVGRHTSNAIERIDRTNATCATTPMTGATTPHDVRHRRRRRAVPFLRRRARMFTKAPNDGE